MAMVVALKMWAVFIHWIPFVDQPRWHKNSIIEPSINSVNHVDSEFGGRSRRMFGYEIISDY